MSTTNVNRDTTAADYLNWLRAWAQSQQAAGTAGTVFTPNYILQTGDSLVLSDSVSLGPVEPASDNLVLTDSMSLTTVNVGAFVIGTAQIGFSTT